MSLCFLIRLTGVCADRDPEFLCSWSGADGHVTPAEAAELVIAHMKLETGYIDTEKSI